ncbi:hypothetical protein GCM10023094_37330 [Rhodococcus olei]|uniref:PPE domain-containing protein n=1 Tax=Rhodococcus olei TaxID=2161675 RepID=A0ABP8PCU7_9NOCA
MTVGFTGVVWFPRGAAGNSTALNAGVGPVGFQTAGAAWGAVAAGLADATATVARVIATLEAGWEGLASDAALTKLTPFRAWTEEAAALAATTAAKAGAEAGAHTVARAAMPSAAEIAAVKAATVAAHTIGGSLAGAGAVAEAADRALDVRAALVMEAYEAASTSVTLPERFTPPPPLVNGTSGAPSDAPTAVPQPTRPSDPLVNPASTQAAVGAAIAQARNPAVVSVASQAGAIAGSGLNAAAGVAVPLASVTVSAAGTAALGVPDTHAARQVDGSSTRRRGGAVGVAGGAGLGAAASGGVAGAARVTLPEGWSGTSRGDGAAPPGRDAVTAGEAHDADPVRVDPATAQRTPLAPTMGGGRGPGGGEEEHRTPDHLKSFEHFEDGRVVIPSVIGAEPADR